VTTVKYVCPSRHRRSLLIPPSYRPRSSDALKPSGGCVWTHLLCLVHRGHAADEYPVSHAWCVPTHPTWLTDGRKMAPIPPCPVRREPDLRCYGRRATVAPGASRR
jgi:hypothetical protein